MSAPERIPGTTRRRDKSLIPQSAHKKIGVRVDDETWEIATRRADRERVVLHGYIRHAVRRYLAQPAKFPTPEATRTGRPKLRVMRVENDLYDWIASRAYIDRTTRSGVVAAAIWWYERVLAAHEVDGGVVADYGDDK